AGGRSSRHVRNRSPASSIKSQCRCGWSWRSTTKRGTAFPPIPAFNRRRPSGSIRPRRRQRHATGFDMARSKGGADEEGIKVVCRNKRALHDYEVFETLECGLVLRGTEVKSLRDGHSSLEDAYAKLDDGEVWLIGSDIPEYAEGNRFNHQPKRPRK